MKGRRVVAMAALWVAVVAGVSSMSWFVIGQAGHQVLAGPVTVLGGQGSTSEPSEPAGPTTTSPTTTPSPPPAVPSPTSAPTSAPAPTGRTATHPTGPTPAPSSSTTSAAVAVDRSIQVDGGSVGVRCTGPDVSLRFAQPANGWSVKVEERGPLRVQVTFETSTREIRVRGECQGGVPTLRGETDSEGPDGSGGSD